MGSEECSHWCHQCNEPVWPQGPGSRCPYCNGGFVQEFSYSHLSTTIPPPWLPNHRDSVRNHRPISVEFHSHPPVDYRSSRGIYDHDYDHDHHHHRQHHHNEDIDHDPHHHHHNNIDEGDDDVIEAIAQLSIDEEEHRGPPRAPEWAIRGLPTVKISARHLNGEGKCPVCQEKFQLRSVARQMPCDHIFHPDCIVPWLERHNTCPVCRFQLPTGSPSPSTRRAMGGRSRNPFSRLFPRLRHRPYP